MRSGFTLLEMTVTMLLLGLLTALGAVAFRWLRPTPEAALVEEIRGVRRDAIRTGLPRVWRRDSLAVRFTPDGAASVGRLTADGLTVTIDRVTGEIRAPR